MKKVWHVVIIIVLISILLGAVSIGVGFMTGAESERILDVMDAKCNLSGWIEFITVGIPDYIREVAGILFSGEQPVNTVTVVTAG